MEGADRGTSRKMLHRGWGEVTTLAHFEAGCAGRLRGTPWRQLCGTLLLGVKLLKSCEAPEQSLLRKRNAGVLLVHS